MTKQSEKTFIPNAVDIAKKEMDVINPNLSDKFSELIGFISLYPDSASNSKGKHGPAIGSVEYIKNAARIFSNSRLPKKPSRPNTIPDEMVGVVLQTTFDIAPEKLTEIKDTHALSMGAENIIGDLLERYLAYELEPHGWIWCSGTIVKAVDFIKWEEDENQWKMLQVKNRDNTENSSSSAIRINTKIIKWFRTFSKKIGSNWEKFPDEVSTKHLSEEKFRDFVINYLNSLK